MAEIVLGIGTSHGPMLSTPPENWHLRAADDRKNSHPYKHRVWTYDELEKARASENIAAQLTPEVTHERYERCQRAIATLSKVFEETRPDAVVVVGNDQMEMFWDGFVPTFAVYWGETIPNSLPPEEYFKNWPPGIQIAMRANAPDAPIEYPGAPDLGLHILKSVQADGFDPASMQKLPPHRGGWTSIPHAFGFIFHRLMGDRVPPTVPIVENTFYPPNQPTVSRSIAFGRALARAIREWDSDKRVAIIGSGGLTHFVIDEEVDAVILEAIRKGDASILEQLTEATFQSGTSETKNWIPVIGAMAELGCEPTIVDYVPCYRSPAGTGNAMGFVYWKGRA
jgi:aromatic ring-opening dioxygenase catalytic subunit (LigB family)